MYLQRVFTRGKINNTLSSWSVLESYKSPRKSSHHRLDSLRNKNRKKLCSIYILITKNWISWYTFQSDKHYQCSYIQTTDAKHLEEDEIGAASSLTVYIWIKPHNKQVRNWVKIILTDKIKVIIFLNHLLFSLLIVWPQNYPMQIHQPEEIYTNHLTSNSKRIMLPKQVANVDSYLKKKISRAPIQLQS